MNAPRDEHAFTTKADVLLSVLRNECHISLAWSPAQGGEAPPLEPFIAIWDTGATNSAITQEVVEKCNLTPTGVAQNHGVHGVQTVETYLVNIGLPNRVVVTNVPVTSAVLTDADILIGMDVIRTGDFAVTNYEGATTFSFRIPSRAHIDFVADAESR